MAVRQGERCAKGRIKLQPWQCAKGSSLPRGLGSVPKGEQCASWQPWQCAKESSPPRGGGSVQ
eukprot:scaffold258497_cov17-Tisochrysis_lutea.AAC.1